MSTKSKKTMSPAALAANRDNGKKTNGATSPAGQRAAQRNAAKHNFFSKELILNDAKKKELDAIRRALWEQLSPETAVQKIQFDVIIACVGRTMLALQAEMRCVAKLQSKAAAEQSPLDEPGKAGAGVRWYLEGKQALRSGMRLIAEVQEAFTKLGRIDEQWKDPLISAFGPELLQSLTEWIPADPQAILMAETLTGHAEMYNLPLPDSLLTGRSEGGDGNNIRVVADPKQQGQMVRKLLDQEMLMLSDLYRSFDEREAASAARAQNETDFTPRYFTAASRELSRAIKEYMFLQMNGM